VNKKSGYFMSHEPEITLENVETVHLKDYTIRLDFFIDLKPAVKEFQNILSLVYLLFLMAQEKHGTAKLPELEMIRMETDTIVFSVRTDEKIINLFKSIIIDIYKLKHARNLKEDHSLKKILNNIYQLHTSQKLKEDSIFCIMNLCISDNEETFAEFIFNKVKIITAINGKVIEERKIYESKTEVLEDYTKNKKEGLMDAIYSELMLDDIDLSGANFKDSDFTKTTLMKTRLEYCQFENANMSEIMAIGANFANADMSCANLTKANLMEALFTEVNLNQSILSGSYLIGTQLRRSNLNGVHLSEAILSRADLFQAKLTNCEAIKTNFVGINAIDTDFSEGDYSYSDFSTARLQGANLTRANFSNAKMLQINLRSISQFDSAIFTDCDWWNAEEISEELLNYLRYAYLPALSEEERIAVFEQTYKHPPDQAILRRQNLYLGIKEVEEDPQEEENKSNRLLDRIINAGTEGLSEEELDQLALDMMKENQ
jgi:uncharacterized protein YjbI with pentapeptide repeats